MIKPQLPKDFDWEFYLKVNPDVAAYPIYNHEGGAQRHWLKFGYLEDRAYKPSMRIREVLWDRGDREPGFSIVIPTMWKSPALLKMLPVYEASDFVKEIILIDNDPENKKDVESFSKVRYYTKGENIYVNPSWNWGYSLSNYDLILANDDILFEDLDSVLSSIQESDLDIIGATLSKNVRDLKIEDIKDFPGNSYGCFMYVRNYIYIPDQIKIWYGDNILFSENPRRGILRNSGISSTPSTTINSDKKLFRETVGKQDIKEYESLSSDRERLNVIIRTSNRPEYFYSCVESIRKHAPDAKLHITIDSVDDLEYVKKYTEGLDYCYYLLDKEVITSICEKVPIERDLFIPNYYFNIIKPFLRGWCLFLDDDDELVYDLDFKRNKDSIYLFKVDIGYKIVPPPEYFGKPPVLNNISGIGIIFHHSQMVHWIPQRGGDYGFITGLYWKYNPVWSDIILSKVQVRGNKGGREDIKDKKISVNIATYPPRKEALIKCLQNLVEIDIIDVIRVYLNEYKTIPKDFPKHDKIVYAKGSKNLKDSGKFFWATTLNDEYYFSADDDLIYPKSYFLDHIKALKKYGNDIFVSSHGKEMKRNPGSFNDNINSYRCLGDVEKDVWINNPGTGVMVFDNSKFFIPLNYFSHHGMADLCVSNYCQKNKIPILCRAHRGSELIHMEHPDTLFDRREELKDDHRKILDQIGRWVLYTKPLSRS